MPLTSTSPEVYVSTMTTVLSNSYYYLLKTLNHMESLKLKYHQEENVVDCCDTILVDAERLEIAGAFNTKHLGYIIYIFWDNSDSRLRL